MPRMSVPSFSGPVDAKEAGSLSMSIEISGHLSSGLPEELVLSSVLPDKPKHK